MTELKEVATREVTEAIVAAVMEKGTDYVYYQINCVYVDNEADGRLTPSCLVGEVMHRLGVPLGTMWNNGNSAPFGRDLAIKWGVDLDSDTAYALKRAQDLQDKRQPWGEAKAGYLDKVFDD